jgi:hypothetical protein
MNAVQFVLSEINELGLTGKINGKQREKILKNYKRDKVEMGTKTARAELRKYLESLKSA